MTLSSFIRLFGLVFVLAGCGPTKTSEAPKPAEEPKKAFEAPKALDEGNVAEALVAKTMLVDTSAPERAKLSKYIQDVKLPSGNLRGVCFVPFDKFVWCPARPVQGGAQAIKDPEPGEEERFASRRPREMVRLGGWPPYAKRYGVVGAIIRIPGILAGKLPPLAYPRFIVNSATRQIDISADGSGVAGIAIGPVGERAQFRNGELCACKLQISELGAGKPIQECTLKAYGDPKYPGLPFKPDTGMANPGVVMSGPLLKTGLFSVTCQRHAWQKAYLCLADNPYLGLSSDGSFSISQIPAGKYKVEVWHPDFEPVSRIHEVEILPDQTTELSIPFQAPQVLKDSLALPDQAVKAWSCAGPFSNQDGVGHAAVYPPEKGVDEKARYTGKEGAAFGWKSINTDAHGVVNFSSALAGAPPEWSTYYFHVTLDSPREQPVVFGVGANESMKIWLNGALLYGQSYGVSAGLQLVDLLESNLKAGANSLLVKVSSQRANGGLALKFKANGVKVMP